MKASEVERKRACVCVDETLKAAQKVLYLLMTFFLKKICRVGIMTKKICEPHRLSAMG